MLDGFGVDNRFRGLIDMRDSEQMIQRRLAGVPDLKMNLLELGPVVARKLQADMGRLLPDIGTIYLNEGIDPAPSNSR